jgi:hypothetical protein
MTIDKNKVKSMVLDDLFNSDTLTLGAPEMVIEITKKYTGNWGKFAIEDVNVLREIELFFDRLKFEGLIEKRPNNYVSITEEGIGEYHRTRNPQYGT